MNIPKHSEHVWNIGGEAFHVNTESLDAFSHGEFRPHQGVPSDDGAQYEVTSGTNTISKANSWQQVTATLN